MSFALHLKEELLKYNLLNHHFYELWTKGEISLETLKDYSKKYLFQVAKLPTYISATHSITENEADRKILTENLADEEITGESHLTLWKTFCKSLGISESELSHIKAEGAIKNLIETCKKYASTSKASGFGVLYAQEHNYANIAKSKREGLQNHYNISGEAVKFFNVHEKADIWHAEQVEALLETLNQEEQIEAKTAGIAVMKALNGFLDEMLEIHNLSN